MYTKGDWRVTEWNNTRGLHIGTDNEHVASIPFEKEFCRTRLEAEANAHLIAAAPKMYKALKYIIRELDKAGIIKSNSIFMEMPNKAVAKAEVK